MGQAIGLCLGKRYFLLYLFAQLLNLLHIRFELLIERLSGVGWSLGIEIGTRQTAGIVC